jgi:HNH endonuclease
MTGLYKFVVPRGPYNSGKRYVPSERAIRDYWCSTDLWDYMGDCGESDFHVKGRCMACGSSGGTEKAHITARVHGGPDTPANIHMLCSTCHGCSEFIEGERYWDWFVDQNILKTGSIRLAQRGISESKLSRFASDNEEMIRSMFDLLRKKAISVDDVFDRSESTGADIRF